jgi:hypothetical protein
MKPIIYLMAVIAVVTIFSSCTKQGPAGPPGPQGNANVQSFIFQSQSFTPGTVISLAVPAITQRIIDSGAVIIYTRVTNVTETDSWTELPWTFESESIDPWVVSVGKATAVANFNSSSLASFDFKVTVIGGQ